MRSDLPKRRTGRGPCSTAACARPAQRPTSELLSIRKSRRADDFFEVFFNLLLGLNNYFMVNGGEEPLFSENSGHRPHERQSGGGRGAELDDRELRTLSHDRLGAGTVSARDLRRSAALPANSSARPTRSTRSNDRPRRPRRNSRAGGRWSPTGPMSSRPPSSSPGPGSKRLMPTRATASAAAALGTTGRCPTRSSHASSRTSTCRCCRPRSTSNRCSRACGGTRPAPSRVRKGWM